MENDNKNTLTNLDILIKASALIVSLSFIISVAYDYGYFKAYGLSFSDVPTTINDHIRNTLVSIPYALAISIFWYIIFVILNINAQCEQSTTQSKFTFTMNKIDKLGNYLTIKTIYIIGIVSLIAYIFIGNRVPLFLIVLGLTVIYTDLIFPRIVSKYNLNNVSREFIILLVFGPLLLLMVFLKGAEVAKDNLSSKVITHKIYLKDVNDTLSVSSIRYFDKFIIVSKLNDLNPTIVFLAEIRKVDQIAQSDNGFKGLINHFGYELR